jgi:CRISPR system Cascade subunit CasD
MPRFLIIKLDGPMQAWGDHTYEDYRPSRDFPTRSGLLGLLAACLGIEREDAETQARLADSVEFTVRADRIGKRRPTKLADFHTVLNARKVDGKANPNPIVSRREYLYDAHFTVAIGQRDTATVSLEEIEERLKKPVFTLSLGRRSCPLARPLLADSVQAETGIAALTKVSRTGGTIYAETPSEQGKPIAVRDVPMHRRKRQFATRKVYVHKEQEAADVHQSD